MLECPKCHYDNDLGRIFCAKCGEKLDISKIAPPSSVKRRTSAGRSKSIPVVKATTDFLMKILKITALAFTTAFVTAIVIPSPVEFPIYDENNLAAFQEKRVQFETATRNKGESSTIVFNEGDINAAICEAVRVSMKTAQEQGATQVERLFFHFDPNIVTVDTQVKIKWYRISSQIQASLVKKDGKWQFQPVAARIGRFKIPNQFGLLDQFAGAFKVFWKDMSSEKEWIEQLENAEIKKGQIIFTTKKEV